MLERENDLRISATTENEEQFRAVLESGRADLIYVDAAYTDPADYGKLSGEAHAAGKLIGLRLPHIWRTEAESYFTGHLMELREAGLNVSCYPEAVKLDKQIKYANKIGVKALVIAGPDELAAGNVTIKNLTDRTQQTVARSEAGEVLKKL